jgi:preprotein translocase subunit SecG
MTNFFIGTLLVIHFLVGIFLVVIVLMQRTKEGGMGAAFGAGVTDSLFGASSGNVLTKITVWTAAIFFATSLSMAVIFSHRSGTTIGAGTLGQTPKTPVAPAITDDSATVTPQGTGKTPTPVNGATLTPPNELPKDGDAPKDPAPAPVPPPEGAAPPPQQPQEEPAATLPPLQPESPKVSP